MERVQFALPPANKIDYSLNSQLYRYSSEIAIAKRRLPIWSGEQLMEQNQSCCVSVWVLLLPLPAYKPLTPGFGARSIDCKPEPFDVKVVQDESPDPTPV